MKPSELMPRTLRACALLCLCTVLAGRAQMPQPTPAAVSVSGTVLDPSGASVPHAALHLHSDSADRDTVTDAIGHFTLDVPGGTYSLTVEADNFRTYTRAALVVSAAHNAPLSIKLAAVTATDEVNVTTDGGESTEAAANRNALVFKSEQLDTFSDDPSTMEQQLLALGGGDPSNPPQLYVDGFSNGTMPPKESIREARINQNPFTAQYDQFGSGRIEIFTKPGANKLHGSAEFNYGNSALNARNPYSGAQPAYYNQFSFANINGPLGKGSSFYASAQRNDSSQNAIINATTLDANLNPLPVSLVLANPSVVQRYSGRVDHQFGKQDTFIGRYNYSESSQPNSGVGQFVLPGQAAANFTRTQTLQLTDTHLFGAHIVLDSGLQFIRTRLRQDATSNATSIVVQGAFSTGGNPAQALHDNTDRLELQQYLSISIGKHFVRTGLRYRMVRDANLSTQNYNGQFVFPSLTAFQITQQQLRLGHSDDQTIRSTCVKNVDGTTTCGGATQFTVASGTPNVSLYTGDLGLYGEDEWKVTPNFTLNYGLRVESQSAIPDHFDVAPRLGFAYSLKPAKAKAPFVVVRGGFGLFYARFDSGNILQSLRQNGVSQKVYFQQNPVYFCSITAQYPCLTPDLSKVTGVAGSTPTVYRINPGLRSPVTLQAMVSAEHGFGKIGSMSVSYYQRHSVRQFESLNLNAPLPDGTRPLGGTGNVYQFSSDGVGNGHTLVLNTNLNPSKHLSLWAAYIIGHQEGDTSSAGYFPSNSYDLHADYGRLAGFTPRRLYSGVNIQPGWDTSLSFFLSTYSRTNFNITTGQDNNGDSFYNDRPAFATDLARPSVVRTAYGNFDTAPLPTQTIIPINYGNAPSLLYLEAYINKNFRFGPRPATPAPPAGHDTPPSGKKAELPPQRYRLQFGIGADNILNIVNAGAPVGVLTSPYFGKSITLNAPFSTNIANRAVLLRSAFYF